MLTKFQNGNGVPVLCIVVYCVVALQVCIGLLFWCRSILFCFCQESVYSLDKVENPLASIFDFQDRPFSLAPHFSDLEHDVFKSKSTYVYLVL